MGKPIYANIPHEYAQPYIGSEDDFQISVAKLLDAYGFVWFHAANERKTSPAAGRKLKEKGVKAGVPDCIIFVGGQTFFIELKVIPNKLSDTQEAWRTKLWHEGFENYAVCYSLDEVEQFCRKNILKLSIKRERPYLAEWLEARRKK